MKSKGLTLVEVLIALSIVAIISGITFVVVKGIKNRINIGICAGHLQKLHSLITLYRAEHGVIHYGDAKTMGFPHNFYVIDVLPTKMFGNYEDWTCPVPMPVMGNTNYYPHYKYLPRPYDPEYYEEEQKYGKDPEHTVGFYNAVAKYGGRTPILLDHNHNNWNETDLSLPRLPKRIIFIDIDGKLTNKTVTQPFISEDIFDFFELDN